MWAVSKVNYKKNGILLKFQLLKTYIYEEVHLKFMVSAVQLVCIEEATYLVFKGFWDSAVVGGRGFRSTHYAGYERFD